ncbi:MAG: FAD-dependent oxidoreductase [Desulfovibrionaceae bacterium]|nr:FAD-dependent oxidoreductase [Desulfovibrionaceae bacterium]
MLTLHTLNEHVRMSTQDLLLAIEDAVARGETDFNVDASGQHDIGGPLWNRDGKKLTFLVRNPGQRVGCMCMPNTEVIVDGPAPADVGWLNAGGRIVVRGDAGDTAGHCAAGGVIYIGGRAGTRSGSLMKHDPLYEAPELWILKNTGSFSFEFMGGGKAIVCGCDSQTMPSVLGERPCVGMVGGVVYVRGPVAELPSDLRLVDIDQDDIAFLDRGLDDFLDSVQQKKRRAELSVWKQWHKIVPLSFAERQLNSSPSIADFRRNEWVKGGIFSTVFPDKGEHNGLLGHDIWRLRVPEWENHRDCAPCEHACPAGIPTQLRYNLLREGKVEEARKLVMDYTPFPGCVCGSVCPNLCMSACTRTGIDFPVQIGPLGLFSKDVEIAGPAPATGKKVAVLGGGVGGLAAAWRLARKGHDVTVFEREKRMGGKMEQVIPRERLDERMLKKEIGRIEKMGVHFVNNFTVDAAKFEDIRSRFDAVIVATGGHKARIFNWPGRERIVPGIDFMKAVNAGRKPKVADNVIVIGCGNAGMDAAAGAYKMGAKKVICIDVQKPAAFQKEIDHIEALGGELIWPVMTKEITEKGIIADDGRLIPGDMVIITIGESPDLSFLPGNVDKFRDWLAPRADQSIMEGVFAVGDTIRPGLLVHAIGSGNSAADACDAWLAKKPYTPAKKTLVPHEALHTAYFARCAKADMPEAPKDFLRCVSCGTCRDCHTCESSCPEKAITREVTASGFAYVSDPERCIGCGVCAGVCPCGVWTMHDNISLEHG